MPAYARTGGPLYYQAPLDYRPTRLDSCIDFLEFYEHQFVRCPPYTYRVRAQTIRIFPPGSNLQKNDPYRADPFTADVHHLPRFRRPVTKSRFISSSENPSTSATIKKGDLVEFTRTPVRHYTMGDGEVGVATEDERPDGSVRVELANRSTFQARYIHAYGWGGWMPEDIEPIWAKYHGGDDYGYDDYENPLLSEEGGSLLLVGVGIVILGAIGYSIYKLTQTPAAAQAASQAGQAQALPANLPPMPVNVVTPSENPYTTDSGS